MLEEYLSDKILEGIDGLILACTHYPLIKNEIAAFYPNKIKIFDSALVVAAKLKWILEKEKLLSDKKIAKDIFYVSDYTSSFERLPGYSSARR